MKKARNLIKRLVRKLRGEDYIFRGDNIIFDESSGNIRHQYSFDEIEEPIRAEHLSVGNGWKDESIVRYHLTKYSGHHLEVWLYLVEDTIHELTHWAVDDDVNRNLKNEDAEAHSKRWKEVIYSEIEYVNEDISIEWNPDDD